MNDIKIVLCAVLGLSCRKTKLKEQNKGSFTPPECESDIAF